MQTLPPPEDLHPFYLHSLCCKVMQVTEALHSSSSFLCSEWDSNLSLMANGFPSLEHANLAHVLLYHWISYSIRLKKILDQYTLSVLQSQQSGDSSMDSSLLLPFLTSARGS
ncbi:hypothetical protein SRHO_G00335790 [Serrasalmus rhombeus]